MTEPRSRFPVKRLPDGRACINLGSSTRVASGWNNVDFSWIIRFGRHRRLSSLLYKLGLIHEARYARILQMDPDAVLWDLSKGIPFADQTFDVVYHCHLLEHIDREAAPGFLCECYRVLRPGGILRVVVPDLERLVRNFVDVMDRLPDRADMVEYTSAIEKVFDQMVLRTPEFRKEQKPIVRLLENVLIGDTARAGILHRWMYDRFSLEQLLREVGFEDVQLRTATTSQIAGWPSFNLDTEPDGSTYKPGSLYMEGRRP
jgi:SAM-dependent methyltransferase